MEFEERNKLIELFRYAETNYHVDEWVAGGFHIWPLVKTTIFFINHGKKTPVKPSSKTRIIKVLKKSGLDVLYSLLWMKRYKIGRAKYLFSGYSAHRVMWKEKFFNRYFDPIIDEIENVYQERSLVFEYDQQLKKQYNRTEKVFDATKLIHYFRWKAKKVEFKPAGLKHFDTLMDRLEKETTVNVGHLLVRIESEINNILSWKSLWSYVLENAKPEFVFVLCYYNSIMFALTLEAKRRGIKSVDMQHGGQGAYHSAYSYGFIPAKGYELLPDYFWTWDNSSADNINGFVKGTPHKVLQGGNPWIDYLRGQAVELDARKIILYTMQTTISPVLHPYITEAIKKTMAEYTWWLRLHPRMTAAEVSELHVSLANAGISEKVEIEKATALALPLILSNSVAHLSHFSGSVIEAALLDVPVNIVIGEIGKQSFKDALDKKEAVYFDPEREINLFDFIREEEHKSQYTKGRVSKSEAPSYKSTLPLFQ